MTWGLKSSGVSQTGPPNDIHTPPVTRDPPGALLLAGVRGRSWYACGQAR